MKEFISNKVFIDYYLLAEFDSELAALIYLDLVGLANSIDEISFIA